MSDFGLRFQPVDATYALNRFAGVRLSALVLQLIALYTLAGAAAPDERQTELVIDNGEQQFRFQVELARTEDEKRTGLQGRQTLAENAGILFLVNPPATATVWMKDTYVTLDILFISSDGRIQDITKEAKPLSVAPIKSRDYDPPASTT